MKRILLCSVIFLSLISLSLFSMFSLSRECGNLMGTVKEVQTYVLAGQPEKALASYRQFAGRWEEDQLWMEVFVHHQKLDEVETESRLLPVYIQNNTPTLACAGVETILAQLQDIADKEKISLQNLL